MERHVDEVLRVKGREVASISPEATVLAAVRSMNEKRIGSLLVMRNDQAVGILTERDVLVRLVVRRIDPATVRVGELMSTSLTTIHPQMTIKSALRMMTEQRKRHLPVVDGGRLVGLVSIGDLTKALGEDLEREVQDLTHYIHGPLAV
ncbi:MAG: CBS domain-containing protein [Sandaracinaceae bacterium]|nr:MAG: CBS domain-containing protein [Sandaracinaceae bacterium]HBQ14211.1 hypothetical protein [Myxococcales bacterium]